MSSRTDLVGLLLLATAVRAIGLDSGLWFDEIVTLVESARLPLAQIVTQFPGINAHPFYSVLAHSSIAALGESAWALRLPAMLFGAASVAATYMLARRVMDRSEAWAGAFILAVSYHHIWFSQNARGYTMMGWCALVATICLLRARDRGRTADYVAYAVVCAAGVYTHLTMALVVAGHAVVVLGGRLVGWRPALTYAWKPLVASWIGAALIAVAAYAPLLPGLLAHFGEARPAEAASIATGTWAIAEALRSVLFGAGVPAAMVGGLAAVVGGVNLWRRAPVETALLVVPALVTAAAILALGQPMRPRFFFFLSGTAAVFAGRGIGILVGRLGRGAAGSTGPRAAWTISASLIIAALSVPALVRNYAIPKQDFDGAVRVLERESASGARVAAAGPACFPLTAYYGRSWPCLETTDELRAFQSAPGRGLVLVTLGDYVADPGLRRELPRVCREVQRLPGTLGGGDMVICDPAAGGRP